MSLQYPDFDVRSRRHVWLTFLNRVARGPFSDEALDKLSEARLNGRQIKNVLKIAHLLATEQGTELRFSHVDTVLKLKAANLSAGFEWTGSTEDPDETVENANVAVPAHLPTTVVELAGRKILESLLVYFKPTETMEYLDRAVEAADMAVDTTPHGHPDLVARLDNLRIWLGRRFERTGSMDDLNRAVEATNMAVDATPQDHPDRAGYLNNLGNWLGRRFERTGSMDDLNRQLSSYREGWSCRTAPPSTRIHLARRAATILTLQSNWEESSVLLQDAVKLLPSVSPRLLQHTDKQHMLADFAGLASMAAATALNAGREAHLALELLELGRGVIAGLLLETRTGHHRSGTEASRISGRI